MTRAQLNLVRGDQSILVAAVGGDRRNDGLVEEKMRSRGLIVAVIILAALTGVLYWSQHRKPPAETPATSTAAAPMILKVDPSTVTELVFKQKGVDAITVEKTQAGQWQITKPKPYRADQEAVAGVLSTLSGLSADRVVEEKATDRSYLRIEQSGRRGGRGNAPGALRG